MLRLLLFVIFPSLISFPMIKDFASNAPGAEIHFSNQQKELFFQGNISVYFSRTTDSKDISTLALYYPNVENHEQKVEYQLLELNFFTLFKNKFLTLNEKEKQKTTSEWFFRFTAQDNQLNLIYEPILVKSSQAGLFISLFNEFLNFFYPISQIPAQAIFLLQLLVIFLFLTLIFLIILFPIRLIGRFW